MKGSKVDIVEMLQTQMCHWCGKVKLPTMKYHIVLQALSSQQAHRRNLKVYVKIVLSERVKPRIPERLRCHDGIVKESMKIYNLT